MICSVAHSPRPRARSAISAVNTSPQSRIARRTALLLLALLSARPSDRLTAQDTLRLTLADVLARVRSEHPLARAGTASVTAASAHAADLARSPNPSIEIERTTFSQADNVALLQPIRWPWESAALHALGRAEVAVAEAEAKRDSREVALDAAQRFADGLRDARAVALAIEAESLAQRGMQRALAARQLGQAGDLTVLQAQVSFDAARRARGSAEAERDASAAALAVVLGWAPGTVIVFGGDLGSVAPLAAPESALAGAATADAEALRLASEADRATQAARLARARRWPELALGPSASLEGRAVLGMSFGVGLPLWNRQGSGVRAAAAEREAALARLDARRRELDAAVVEATSTLGRAGRELDALRSGELARAEQAESLAARALQQGGPYLAAWLAARQAYLDARRVELNLEWQAARARLLLRHLTGTLLAEEPK